MKTAVVVLCLLVGAICRGSSLEISAHLISGGEHLFVVRDTASKEVSGWLRLGESWHGHTLSAFDPVTEKLATTPDKNGHQERLIRVRASPQNGFASKPFERLVLVAAGSTYLMDWYAGSTHHAPVLLPGQQYDFVLTERSNPRRYGNAVWHDVFRVSLGQRVLFDSRVCEVHGAPLESKLIPTRHGYSGFPDVGKLEARKHTFPHAESGRTVTCEPLPDEPAMTQIWICRECETAYQQWTQDRAKP